MNILVEVGIDVKRFELICLISQKLIVVAIFRLMGESSEWISQRGCEYFALTNFEIEPISAEISGIVAVIPVAVDRVANVERVSAGVHENGGDSVTVLTMPEVVIGILMIDFQ